MLPAELIYERVIVLRPDMMFVDNVPSYDNNYIYFQCICKGCMGIIVGSRLNVISCNSCIAYTTITNSKLTKSIDNNTLLFFQARKIQHPCIRLSGTFITTSGGIVNTARRWVHCDEDKPVVMMLDGRQFWYAHGKGVRSLLCKIHIYKTKDRHICECPS